MGDAPPRRVVERRERVHEACREASQAAVTFGVSVLGLELRGYRRESETVAKASLGRARDVCKGARFPMKGDWSGSAPVQGLEFREICSGSEAGSYLRLIGTCIN